MTVDRRSVVSAIEEFLHRKNIYTGRFKDRAICSRCGEKRYIYQYDMMNREARCFDCDTKFIVDTEMSNGTDRDIRTRFYMSEGRYMTVEDVYIQELNSKPEKWNLEN